MYYSLGEEEAVILDHRDSANAAGLLEVLRGARVLACRVSARSVAASTKKSAIENGVSAPGMTLIDSYSTPAFSRAQATARAGCDIGIQ